MVDPDPWAALTNLPDKRAFHQLLSVAGNLYVVGGTNSAVDPTSNVASAGSQSTVLYDSISLVDGTLGSSWTTNANAMGKAREKFTAVVAGGYLFVSGGLYNGAANGSSEESYASLNSDGSVSSFNGATGSHTISGSAGGYNFFNQAAGYFVDSAGNPHVAILGGAEVGSGAPKAECWYQH